MLYPIELGVPGSQAVVGSVLMIRKSLAASGHDVINFARHCTANRKQFEDAELKTWPIAAKFTLGGLR